MLKCEFGITPTSGIHPVFNVSLLKKVASNNLPILPLPVNVAPDLTFVLQPIEVL